MDTFEAIKTRRTIRRFKQDLIPDETLIELIEAARSAPSAANHQPLEYVIVSNPQTRGKIFEQLAWAAYVQPNRTPPANSRPVAYIIVLINSEIELADFGRVDAAAAIQNILLAAWNKKIGTCWLGSVNRENVHGILKIPQAYKIDSVITLGFPDEKPVMEDCKDDSIKYYLDSNDNLHVPKRPLKKITHINKFTHRLE